MKFGHQIAELDGCAPSVFRGKWLKYKQLKKMLKKAKEDEKSANFFFLSLERDLLRVNRCAQMHRYTARN